MNRLTDMNRSWLAAGCICWTAAAVVVFTAAAAAGSAWLVWVAVAGFVAPLAAGLVLDRADSLPDDRR